ncbi:MAG: sugar ABC transporter permease [Mesorhizobium sp.]|nr:sugar ABC transporter permease [Mesorhizobium sp.]MBL8579096.1 sugar ABC transporter permease [Mesorhizobium sp.]
MPFANSNKGVAATAATSLPASTNRYLGWSERWLPKLSLFPTLLVSGTAIYVFIVWTGVLSFTGSRMLPRYNFVGFDSYRAMFATERFGVAATNIVIYASLYIAISLALGLLLAILLDQKVRGEGLLRMIFLFPMSLSLIVTGVVWRWIFNPGLGLEKFAYDMGFVDFKLDWIINPSLAIYTLVIAAIWQSSGFVMVLMLAGLRGVDGSIIRAAQIDGASMPYIYWKIVLPLLAPVIFSATVILGHLAIKNFDLVVAMTNGGPGYATDMPATFMYAYSFERSQIAVGAASSIIMLGVATLLLVPYLYIQIRRGR